MLLKGNHIWKDFSDLNQQKYVQSENLKYLKKFEDKHEKLDFRFLPEKCNLWLEILFLDFFSRFDRINTLYYLHKIVQS